MKIIKNPRITEKATSSIEQNVYTFDVEGGANKTEIKKAIFSLYKVKPVQVNILAVPTKKISFRGKFSSKGGGKKAVVYLKKGDKIEFI
mgnify:CR=1 FL=1